MAKKKWHWIDADRIPRNSPKIIQPQGNNRR